MQATATGDYNVMTQLEHYVAVSVILPVYNAENYISECIDSISKQTLDSIEIICVNDGSTDNTPAILDQISQTNPLVAVINQNNSGAGAARNVGIDAAKGEYLAFIDPDDRFSSVDVLETLYRKATEGNYRLVCGTMNYLVGNRSFPAKLYKCNQEGFVDVAETPMCFGHTRFIYHNSLFANKTVRYPVYRRFQDPPFLARAIVEAGGYYCLNKPVNDYRRAYKREVFSESKLSHYLLGVRDLVRFTSSYGMKSAHSHAVSKTDYYPVLKALMESGDEARAIVFEIENAISGAFLDNNSAAGYRTLAARLVSGDASFTDEARYRFMGLVYEGKITVYKTVFGVFDR